MLREEAYRLVQRNAIQAFETRVQFDEKLKADPEVLAVLTPDEISALFNMDKYLHHVDAIFDRVYDRK